MDDFLLLGFGTAALLVSSNAIPYMFASNQLAVIGILEISQCAGLMGGAAIGSI